MCVCVLHNSGSKEHLFHVRHSPPGFSKGSTVFSLWGSDWIFSLQHSPIGFSNGKTPRFVWGPDWTYIYSTVLNSSQYPRSVHVRFVVDRVAMGQIFLQVPHFSPVSTILPMLHTHFDLYIGATRRANGRSLGTCQEKWSFRNWVA